MSYYLNYIVPFGDCSIDHIFCWLCIFIVCHLVTLTFDIRIHKCIQLKYMLLSINWPNLRKIRWQMAEKSQNADSGKEIKKIIITRIEPVGKPYREVCLHSELWHRMAHQPNSWSKHPGTRIEQVLAYCREEQKYVGCIELLFCLTETMTFGVQTWQFIGLMDEIRPIYQPSFTEIRSKIREK